MSGEERFPAIVTADPTVLAVLEHASSLGVGDWWLTAGVLFRAVWNAMTGRPAGTGIRDADRFRIPAPTSADRADAIDSFAAVCCCVGITAHPTGARGSTRPASTNSSSP